MLTSDKMDYRCECPSSQYSGRHCELFKEKPFEVQLRLPMTKGVVRSLDATEQFLVSDRNCRNQSDGVQLEHPNGAGQLGHLEQPTSKESISFLRFGWIISIWLNHLIIITGSTLQVDCMLQYIQGQWADGHTTTLTIMLKALQ